METELINATTTVTRRRKGGIGRIVTGPGHRYEYWQAYLRVDGKVMTKTSKDRAAVEAWLEKILSEHPTYTYPMGLRGGLRPRRGFIRAYTTKRGKARWRATVTVEYRTVRQRFGDRAEAERWLAGVLRDHPLCWWGPHPSSAPSSVEVDHSSVEVEVSPAEDATALMAALPSVHFKYRPDLGLEIVHGHDPADIRRALGWDAARTKRALDHLVEKGRMIVHVTKWGPLHQSVAKEGTPC